MTPSTLDRSSCLEPSSGLPYDHRNPRRGGITLTRIGRCPSPWMVPHRSGNDHLATCLRVCNAEEHPRLSSDSRRQKRDDQIVPESCGLAVTHLRSGLHLLVSTENGECELGSRTSCPRRLVPGQVPARAKAGLHRSPNGQPLRCWAFTRRVEISVVRRVFPRSSPASPRCSTRLLATGDVLSVGDRNRQELTGAGFDAGGRGRTSRTDALCGTRVDPRSAAP